MANTRGEIYASILHDLNGPLTVISGFVQMLNQRIDKATQLEVQDLEFIKDRLKTITRQVTNCIDISRRYLSLLQRRSEEAPRVPVNGLLKDVEHLLRVHPSRQNHQFTIRSLAEDIAVRMNGTDLIQVLLNLAVNAFQCAAQAHTVAIETQLLAKGMDLAAIKDGPQDRLLNVEGFDHTPPVLMVVVRDNGPGISAELLPKIFQASFSTKAPGQGTGLGLNIVMRLIKEAKGALHVHTQVGEGTRFAIYLPAVPLVAARPPAQIVLK